VADPLRALTVHQPWAWALAGGWKPVENRDWPPPPWMLGKPLAIHAGRQYDGEAAAELAAGRELLGLPIAPPKPSEIALGQIVAVARIAGAVFVAETEESRPGELLRPKLEVRRILGNVAPGRAAELAASPWSCGPFLWVLEDVVRIDPPVPCRGFQKLWTVPTQITDVVRERYREARARSAA
jgi:hypothetical protein